MGLDRCKKAVAQDHLDSLLRLGQIYLDGSRKMRIAENRLEGERYCRRALASGVATRSITFP